MLDPKKSEFSWLGAEALPAGLTQINETIQTWAEASSRKQHFSHRESRPAGLIAIAVRWMQKATRPN